MSNKPAANASRPALVTLNTALKLAEKWVNNMSKSIEDDKTEVELTGRPLRLGLGATVPRQTTVGPINNPVERQLRAKLEIGKRKGTESVEEVGDNDKRDDEDDKNSDSRTGLFVKKKVMPSNPFLQAKKKKRKD